MSSKLGLLSPHWYLLAGPLRYWKLLGRWDGSTSVVHRLTHHQSPLQVPTFLFSVFSCDLWLCQKSQVALFYMLNYLLKIHWIHSRCESSMTNEQVVTYFQKQGLWGPLLLRVSLHIVGGAFTPHHPTAFFILMPTFLPGPACQGAVQNSAGRPPGYRAAKRFLKTCQMETQWQLWIASRAQRRSTADSDFFTETWEKKKEVTNVSEIFPESEVNKPRKEPIFHRHFHGTFVGCRNQGLGGEKKTRTRNQGLNVRFAWAAPRASPWLLGAWILPPWKAGEYLLLQVLWGQMRLTEINVVCKDGIGYTYVKYY